MAIVNRDLDISQRKEVITISFPQLILSEGTTFTVIKTGVTLPVSAFPYPAEIRDIYVSAIGPSGSPAYTFDVWKQGNGASAFSCTGALTVQAVGTSGPQRCSMLAAGGTAVQVNALDLLVLKTATANTAVNALSISIVVQALQDIKAHFGVNT